MNTTALLEAARAEAQALAAEVASLRGHPDGLRLLLADGAALVDHCKDYPPKLRRHWESFRKAAESAALPVDQLGPFFTSLLALAGASLKAVDAARVALGEAEQLLREAREEPGVALAAPDLGALDTAIDALLALQTEVATFWVWLKTPMPPGRPLRTTAEIREARARGEYVSVEDAVAGLGGTPAEAS